MRYFVKVKVFDKKTARGAAIFKNLSSGVRVFYKRLRTADIAIYIIYIYYFYMNV